MTSSGQPTPFTPSRLARFAQRPHACSPHSRPAARCSSRRAAARAINLRFYRHFLDDLRDGQGTLYAASEDLAEALRACGADPHAVRLSYDHTTALENTVTVEGYLQRCAFDDSVSLQEMMTAPHLGPYLRDCRDKDGDVWRFHQEVDVLLLGPRLRRLDRLALWYRMARPTPTARPVL